MIQSKGYPTKMFNIRYPYKHKKMDRTAWIHFKVYFLDIFSFEVLKLAFKSDRLSIFLEPAKSGELTYCSLFEKSF